MYKTNDLFELTTAEFERASLRVHWEIFQIHRTTSFDGQSANVNKPTELILCVFLKGNPTVSL